MCAHSSVCVGVLDYGSAILELLVSCGSLLTAVQKSGRYGVQWYVGCTAVCDWV